MTTANKDIKDDEKGTKDAPRPVVTAGGVIIEGKVVTGEETKLSVKEQGELARGEIDEKGKRTDKEVKPVDTNMSKVKETLYQGTLTLTAEASATGQTVSVRVEQAEPTTEDGLFYHMLQYHPSAKRDTFKVDTSNTDDPTLRTYLEK